VTVPVHDCLGPPLIRAAPVPGRYSQRRISSIGRSKRRSELLSSKATAQGPCCHRAPSTSLRAAYRVGRTCSPAGTTTSVRIETGLLIVTGNLRKEVRAVRARPTNPTAQSTERFETGDRTPGDRRQDRPQRDGATADTSHVVPSL
jgi:hypothetical protein